MKYEVHAQLGIVEVIEYHERRTSNRVHTKPKMRMRSFDCRKCCQHVLDCGIDAIALLGDDAYAKRLDALGEERVELVESCLREPDGSHVRDGATPRLARA